MLFGQMALKRTFVFADGESQGIISISPTVRDFTMKYLQTQVRPDVFPEELNCATVDLVDR